MKFISVLVVVLIFVNPCSAVLWRVITAPASWLKNEVVDRPLKMGAAVRHFVSGTRSTEKKPLNLSEMVDGQYVPDFVDGEDALLSGFTNIMRPRIKYDGSNGTTPYIPKGNDINLDQVLSSGYAAPLSKIAAAKLEIMLKPILDATKIEDEGDEIEDFPFDKVLVDRYGSLKDGQHVFDGDQLILNLRPKSGKVNNTDVKVVYVDLSELKSSLNERPLLTVFTGLGNSSSTLPFGMPDVPGLDFDETTTSPSDTPSLPMTDLPIQDYGDYVDSQNPVVEDEQLLASSTESTTATEKILNDDVPANDINGQLLEGTISSTDESIREFENVASSASTEVKESPETKEMSELDESSGLINPKPTETSVSFIHIPPPPASETIPQPLEGPIITVPSMTFEEKLRKAANKPPINLESHFLNLDDYLRPNHVPNVILKPYGRVSVNQPNKVKPNPTKEPETEPFYVPTGSPTTPEQSYKPFIPGPVYSSEVKETAKPSIPTSTPDIDADEEMKMVIAQHVERGLEGYLSHLRKHHDKQNCVSLMVCEIGAMPERYGHHGQHVVKFFENKQFSDEETSCKWYQTVLNLGSSLGAIPMCRSSFRPCLLNTQQLKELGRGLMFDVILS